MIVGDWQVDTVSGGPFRLDGGAMFGVVPKPVWEKSLAADEKNRIPMETNCVLARDGSQVVLIDTGYGSKLSDVERGRLDAVPGNVLVENLARLGVAPEDVDTVVFSHLHFDHAGGGTRNSEQGEVVPTFPRAAYVAGQQEWEDAMSGCAELRGAYPVENLSPIEQAGKLRLIRDGDAVAPGWIARQTGGHTRGHQALVLESGGAPWSRHLPTHDSRSDSFSRCLKMVRGSTPRSRADLVRLPSLSSSTSLI